MTKTVIVLEKDMMKRVQILDEFGCVSLHANAIWKGLNTPVLSLAMGK